MQTRIAPSGEVLPDPLLGCVKIGVGGMIQPFQQIELCFQIPMPGHVAILITEVGQHGHQPLVVIKDQHALFVAAGANPHRLKNEAHAATSSRTR